MDAIECIKTRMSIRKFKLEPVPMNVLMDIIDTARWSPSYKNSQPWEVLIISGKKKEELSKMLIGMLDKCAEQSPDIAEPKAWPPVIDTRINSLLKKRGEALGVDLNSPEIRKKSKAVNFQFYGAPHGIFLFQDSSLNEWSIFDIGLFSQSLMLAAHARGIGTVPQAFLTDYAKETKKFLGIPASKRLVLGISIGYADMSAKINNFRTDRADTSETVRIIE